MLKAKKPKALGGWCVAEQTLQMVPSGRLAEAPVSYVVDFNGQQRQAGGIRHRLGRNAVSGPVALKVALDEAAMPRLQRELEVARYLGSRGGELLSKCVGYNFGDAPASTVVTYRGQPLSDLVRDEANWPPDHLLRTKIITDLLQGLELLRVSSIVHGGISLDTVHWDGTTVQIIDFGQAALSGKYPDGQPAHHGDDIRAAGGVIYHVYTGQPAPADSIDLRQQLGQVQDTELRDLLLHRDHAGADIDYVFAEDWDRRPTSRILLRRLDTRPHGVQWQQMVARDRAVRDDFRQLRERQRRSRNAYARWEASSRSRPAGTTVFRSRADREAPRPAPGKAGERPAPPGRKQRQAASRHKPAWLLIALVIGLSVAILTILRALL
jgi:hypothetical protein